jgi:RimJ/RimL family protein N-acetyltransferase
MQPLSTDRLNLRAWTDADVDFVFDMYSRWDVQQYIGRAPRVLADRSEAAVMVERWRATNDPVHGTWAVEERGVGRPLGTVLLKSIPASSQETPLPPSADIEIGWHLHPEAWGHGYATEAATRVLDHAFSSGLNRVVAVTYPANRASQAVAQRIGMVAAGETDRYYNTTLALFVAQKPGSS